MIYQGKTATAVRHIMCFWDKWRRCACDVNQPNATTQLEIGPVATPAHAPYFPSCPRQEACKMVRTVRRGLLCLVVGVAICATYFVLWGQSAVYGGRRSSKGNDSYWSHGMTSLGLSDAIGYKKRLPGAIIIGVMKCGTVALKSFLSSHPDIALRYNVSVHFFSSPIGGQLESLGVYRDKMAYSTPGQLTLEGSPRYFKYKSAPARIKAALPGVKLIVLFRDPVNRSVSEYLHILDMASKRGMPRDVITSDEAGKVKGPRREVGSSFEESVSYPNGSLKTYNPLLAKGRYADALPNWFQAFSRERILILDGDVFAKNPLPQLKKVETFLGVRPFFSRDHFVYNKEKGFYCFVKNRLSSMQCLMKAKGRAHPTVDPVILKRLKRYFAPSVQELSVLLNRTFSWSSNYQDVV